MVDGIKLVHVCKYLLVIYHHNIALLQKKAKEFGQQRSMEKIDAEEYIAASAGKRKKKKSKTT